MSESPNHDLPDDFVRFVLGSILRPSMQTIQVTLNENGEPSFDEHSPEHRCDNPNCLVHRLLNKSGVTSTIPEKNEVKPFIDERDTVGLQQWCQDVTKVNQVYGATTPLIYAMKTQWIEGMEILLTNSASPNYCKDKSLPPLFIASSENMLLPLVTLIKYNATIDAEVSTKFCKTPINVLEFLCFANGSTSDRNNPIATFTYLINLIASTNQYDHLLWKVDSERKNILHICAITDTMPFLVQLLHVMKSKNPMKTKEYINMFSKKGYTPLHLAVKRDDALVSVFCGNGANVDARMPTADASTPSELTQDKDIKTVLNAYRIIQRSQEVPPLVEAMEDLEQ
uniref:Ankyrin repeat protein n=1 Tax=Clandestinovirus TaxID=2831644 RepID=A0A8F8KPI5_9VIRU|nr:ankyrin repeat protein [Clandestinovirus]